MTPAPRAGLAVLWDPRLLYAPRREKNEGIPGWFFVRSPLCVVGLPGTVARSQEPAVSADQKLFPCRPLTTDHRRRFEVSPPSNQPITAHGPRTRAIAAMRLGGHDIAHV